MEILEAMICWTPNKFENDHTKKGCVVVAWPDSRKISNDYFMTTGACFMDRHKMEKHELEKMLFVDFHTLVVRDGIDPQEAHNEFLKIKRYRELISPDIRGAE